MRNLRKFESEEDMSVWQQSSDYVKPNVVLTQTGGDVFYNVEKIIPKGVYIQHIDGSLYTTDDWTTAGFANTEANGVAVLSENARFVMAKGNQGSSIWSSNINDIVSGVPVTSAYAEASADFNGQKNTEALIATGSCPAATKCADYVFPNGKKGYLPAFGEWMTVKGYISDVESALKLIGGTAIKISGSNATYSYLSSTQYSADKVWVFRKYNYAYTQAAKNETRYVRAFCSL